MTRAARATRKHKQMTQRFAGEFDATALHNLVYSRLSDDTTLTQLLDAAVATDQAANSYDAINEASGYAYEVEQSYYTLENAAEKRAAEVVAEACQEALANATEWLEADDDEAWTADEVTDARIEASAWLEANSEAAQRAGVLPETDSPTPS